MASQIRISKLPRGNETKSGDLIAGVQDGKTVHFDIDDIQLETNQVTLSDDNGGSFDANSLTNTLKQLQTDANRYVGVEVQPTITTDGVNATLTIEDDGVYYVFREPQHFGIFESISPDTKTFDITDEKTTYYIYAEYVKSTDTVQFGIAQDLRKFADGNVAPIIRVVRTGEDFHIFRYTRLALGLPEKLNSFVEFNFNYLTINGLSTSVDNQQVTIGAGEVTLGVSITDMPEVTTTDSAVSFDQLIFNGTDFDVVDITELNNTQYQGATGLVDLSTDFYNVQWIWRGVEEAGQIYVVANEQEYATLEDAQDAPLQPVPQWIRDTSVAVGRVIYQKGSTTAASVSNVTSDEFDTADAVRHNSLSGLQGGTGGEYFHLTAGQHNDLTNHVGEGGTTEHPDVTTSTSGFMSPSMLSELNYVESQTRDNHVLIKTAADFPDPVNEEIQLADNTYYEIEGQVTVDFPLVYGTDTFLAGKHWFKDVIVYTGTGDAIIVTDVDFYIRNLTVSAPNGNCFNATSTVDNELLMVLCAFSNCINVGSVDGFRSPAFINANVSDYQDGITFSGTMDQVFFSEVPFRLGADNSRCIIFDSTFVGDFISIINSFFKNVGIGSVGIDFDSNATLNQLGLVTGNTFDDGIQPTQGFDQTTVGWDIQGNDGIANSTITGFIYYSPIVGGPVGTTITTQNEWVKLNIPTQTSGENERMQMAANNRLQYLGDRNARLQISCNWSGTSVQNNTAYQLAIAVNGVVQDSTVVPLTLRSSTDAQTISMSSIITLATNDYVEVYIRNTGGTANINTRAIQLITIR